MEYVTADNPKGIGNPNELDFDPKLYIKSKFNPPFAPFFVEDELFKFRDMVTELYSLLPKFPLYNLDKIQRNIISSLWNNPNIVLLNADKGQGLVAMDRKEYMQSMLEQHCYNEEYYVHLIPTQAATEMEDASSSIK